MNLGALTRVSYEIHNRREPLWQVAIALCASSIWQTIRERRYILAIAIAIAYAR